MIIEDSREQEFEVEMEKVEKSLEFWETKRQLYEAYQEKWDSDLNNKYIYLVKKYGGDKDDRVHDDFLNSIKWSDKDLQNIEGIMKETNVVVIGNIQPPITPEELEVLSCDPK